MDDDGHSCNETDDVKSDIRNQLISLEASLAEKERRVSQLELELSEVQAKCKVYKKECKQLSKELRSRRQDLRDCLRASKRCRMYEKSESCRCHCHDLECVSAETQTFATDFYTVESSGSALDWVPNEDGLTIADVVKEAVTSVSQSSDYVYDENSKLYYSISTGYYYDPVQKLFYEPHSRIYYSYNETDRTYHFHSRLRDPAETKARKRKKNKKKELRNDLVVSSPTELEEGEISSESSQSDSVILVDDSAASDHSDEDNPDKYPPSMRLIVKKSEELLTGSLLLVTYEGASVGRTEDQGVCLLDNGISRTHARIEYSANKSCYLLYDCGSQNGTFVNQKRLTGPKMTSEEGWEVHHGDWVTFGTTELVAHIHSGNNTCDQCEPGLVLQKKKTTHTILSKAEREEKRKEELRRMKKKYALSDFVSEKTAEGYKDRAEQRRKTVGSSNPYEKDAEPSSVDKPLSADNPGFRMLQKLGWKEGEPLGQGDAGQKEPVNALEDGQIGRAGLGTRAAFKELCANGDVQIVIVPSGSKTLS